MIPSYQNFREFVILCSNRWLKSDRPATKRIIFRGVIKLTAAMFHPFGQSLTPLRLSYLTYSGKLGSIRLKVRLSEERILPSKFYQPLVKTLVDSVSDSVMANQDTALSVLEELTTADCKAVAHELVKLFLGQDKVIPFLDYITTREIKRTGE